MSKEYHFVVVVQENGNAYVDQEMDVNYGGGEVWDTETEEWSHLWDNENYEKSQVMFATLRDILTATNEREK